MIPPQDTIVALEHLQLLLRINVASMVVLAYDYLLTLPREISLIWPSRWTWIKVLYLLSRYSPFWDLAFRIYTRFQQEPDCLFDLKVTSCSFLVGILFPEIILTFRTWGVWNRDRRLSIGLAIFFIVCFGPMLVVLVMALRTKAYVPLEDSAIFGCLITTGSRVMTAPWVLLLAYEAGISALMLIKGIRYYTGSVHSKTLNVIFRNGLIYYLLVFAFSAANVVVACIASPNLRSALFLADRFAHSIVACRVVLDIRGELESESCPPQDQPLFPPQPDVCRVQSLVPSIVIDIARDATIPDIYLYYE